MSSWFWNPDVAGRGSEISTFIHWGYTYPCCEIGLPDLLKKSRWLTCRRGAAIDHLAILFQAHGRGSDPIIPLFYFLASVSFYIQPRSCRLFSFTGMRDEEKTFLRRARIIRDRRQSEQNADVESILPESDIIYLRIRFRFVRSGGIRERLIKTAFKAHHHSLEQLSFTRRLDIILHQII